MPSPLRMPNVQADGAPAVRSPWRHGNVIVPAVILIVVMLTGLIAVRSQNRAAGPASGIAVACFGARPVCLADDPRLPWLSYYRQHALRLGEVLWQGDFQGRLACIGFRHYVVCPSTDPRTRGTLWQFEPVELGTELLPRGLRPQLDPPLPPVVTAYIERLQQERQDPAYWLGRAITEPFCTRVAGPGEDGGECEVWFTTAQIRYPNRASVTAADVYLGDLGRQVRP